jgi:hypothetical protein
MVCCSNNCERKHLCANHIDNPRESYGIETVIDYYYFGSGSISSKGCADTWWCGPHGNWEMFTPINPDLLRKQIDRLNDALKELEKLREQEPQKFLIC